VREVGLGGWCGSEGEWNLGRGRSFWERRGIKESCKMRRRGGGEMVESRIGLVLRWVFMLERGMGWSRG